MRWVTCSSQCLPGPTRTVSKFSMRIPKLRDKFIMGDPRQGETFNSRNKGVMLATP